MRHALAIVLLTALCCTPLFADATFAPLLTDDTVAVVRVNIAELEPKNVKAYAVDAVTQITEALGFDDDSKTETLKDLNTDLDGLIALTEPFYTTLTKKFGITEFAIIVNLQLVQQNVPAIIALPWKGKTPENVDAFNRFLLEFMPSLTGEDYELSLSTLPFDTVCQVGDFLLIPLADVGGQLAVKGWFAQRKPSTADSKIAQAFAALPDSDIQIAVAVPDEVRKILLSIPLPPDFPNELKGLMMFALQKVEWANASFNFFKPTDSDVMLTVKMATKRDAVQMRGLLDMGIDLGTSMMRFGMEQQSDGDAPPMPPVFFTFFKGWLRTLLPDVEDSKLIFRNRMQLDKMTISTAAPAIIGVQTALLLPAIQAARTAARRTRCVNNLKQIVLALHNYHDVFNGFPPLYTVDSNGKPLHSWRVLILPFIEETELYSQIRLNEPWDSEYNSRFHDKMPAVFRCPLVGKADGCCYSGVAGEAFVPASKASAKTGIGFQHITDGTSNTLAVVEVSQPFCWMNPTADITLDELVEGINQGRVGSVHPGGCNVGVCDGSVRFISNGIDAKTLRAIGTKAGGEPVHVP
ncbi:MAG: DUF1559 domain-containing protein [Thermoguttaceae bacterium]